jgi:hypothetical protein
VKENYLVFKINDHNSLKESMVVSRLVPLCISTAILTFSFFEEAASDEFSPGNPNPVQSDSVHIVTIIDGSTMIGRITSKNGQEIILTADIGMTAIPLAKIKKIKTVAGKYIHDGKYWFPEPNPTNLFFAPTGIMLKKGRGYFADYWLFFPMVHYGFANRFSLGGGISVVPISNLNGQAIYVSPKVGIHQSEYLNIAAGAYVINLPDEEKPYLDLCTFYGAATAGNSDANITFSLGYTHNNENDKDSLLAIPGGKLRISRRMLLMSENWIAKEKMHMLCGVRFFTESFSVDLAVLRYEDYTENGNEILNIPYVDFVWNFK